MHARPVRTRGFRRPRLIALLLGLALVTGVVATGAPAAPARAAAPVYTIFAATAAPTVTEDPDVNKPVELGMKFTSSVAGTVTGVRFWKAASNLGTHTGSLWDLTGKRLATVTFAGESASGWQQARFTAPYAIKANTVYVISYYATKRYSADPDYFDGRSVASGPLTALANGTNGGNGVYRYGTGGGYPQSSWRASNYWVDAVFTPDSYDDVKPTVIDKTPAAGATGVSRSTAVTATFSEPINPNTITFKLLAGTAPNQTEVPSSFSYDATTRIATLRTSVTLANTTTYTASLSNAQDTATPANTMDPLTWSFTTSTDPGNCPCTLFTNVPERPVIDDNSAVNLGVRFRSSIDGFVTGIRFYKGSTQNGGIHTGSLWTNDGSRRLAKVTFANETASGWQSATFSAPVKITANTNYVASYYAPQGYYSAGQPGAFAGNVTNGPLTALADAPDAHDGAYLYGGEAFPTNGASANNYYVDVSFDTSAVDGLPPSVVDRAPAADSTGVAATTTVLAGFSEDVQPSTVSLKVVKAADSSAVAGTTSYDASTYRASFTPSAVLAYSTKYTVTVSGAKDAAGNTMTALTWSFTTGAEPPLPPDQGPGGPIALVTSSANPYSKFYAEILRTEGLNEFKTIDVSTVSATTLAAYDVVLLGEVPVTSDQASALTNWVTSGGNLIAMRPGANLSSLLGITAAGSSLDNGYLKIDPAAPGGAGIVSETIQYHSPADRYTANSGTQTVAALYADAATATGQAAVTVRNVGTAGGQAVAFSYDLAKSVALTRQGNPAWAGTERDNNIGAQAIRSDDMFFGSTEAGTGTDWVNFAKVAIPQADEQQRLLANLIQVTNRDKKPLPRFWYFPNSAKAVVVATGDDHNNNGTAGRFDQWKANSPAGCTATNWTCYRYSSYLWLQTPLTEAAAAGYTADGFEVGLHGLAGGNAYDATSIKQIYDQQVASFRAKYPSLPNARSTRMHAIVWNDWASQPKAELSNGINTDTNYYYFPAEWIKDRPGFMTGSGMAMRFTDTDGTMIDNYQAATQMTDESGQTYPYNVNTLMDNALNPDKGYYGSFVANLHTDSATEPDATNVLNAVIQRNTPTQQVPIVSARQLTEWLDGRNASSYSGVSWGSNKLTFTVKIGTGANNLVAMIPTAGPNGAVLSGIAQGSTAVTFTKSTIKGLEYASFKPTSATYTVTYGAAGANKITSTSSTTKQVSGKLATSSDAQGGTVQVAPDAATTTQTANVSWATTTPASSTVLIGTSPAKLAPASESAEATTAHSVAVEDLKPSTTYYYRVVSTDTTGKTVTSPAADEAPAKMTTAAADTTAPVASDIEVTPVNDYAVVTWKTDEEAAGGVRVTSPGLKDRDQQVSRALTKDHSFTLTDLKPGSTYVITIGSQDAAGNRSTSKAARLITPSPGTGQAGAPEFQLGSTSGSAMISSAGPGGVTLAGATSTKRTGSFTSNLLDARRMVAWDRATFGVKLPTDAAGALYVRTGSTNVPDSSWTEWTKITLKDRWRVAAESRYIQYRVDLSAPAGVAAPVLFSMGFSSNSDRVVDPKETTG